MSELEIIKREEYKQNRKKWMMIQIITILCVLGLALGSFIVYDRLNRTYYIEYTECSTIDYKVQYKENEFFEEEWIGKDQAYIASLINSIAADFNYELKMDVNNVDFEYLYTIDSLLTINDKDTGDAYYTIEERLVPLTQTKSARSTGVNINEHIDIDYVRYNAIASSFVKTYGLKNSTSTLIVSINVKVVSTSESFEQNNENTYTAALNIPLAAETFSVEMTASAPQCDSKILAYKNTVSRKVFYIIGIVTAIIDVLLVIGLLFFLHFTTNEDVTYAAKVRKLTNSYGAFIQHMTNAFNDEGYQRVMIETFIEMLSIRDTLQSPILMFENKDKTKTTFIIPTDSKLLYVFELKVDNYDELYSKPEENK